MQSHFHTSKKGYKIHWQIENNVLPETTVFLHGNVASNRWWLPTLEEAQKNKTGKSLKGAMITIEFLGCGKSDAPKSVEDVNLIEFASDFVELLKSYQQESGENKINLVGHSTGGFIAAAMTALEPKMFKRALLLDPVGAKGLTLDENIKAGFEAMKADKNITALAIGATIHNNDPKSDFFNQVIVEDAFSAVQKISYWVVQGFHNLDATDLLSKSDVETLVLHGEFDNLLSREASEELAVKYLKKAKFEIVPGHSHCMNVENPAAFFKKMSGFLYA